LELEGARHAVRVVRGVEALNRPFDFELRFVVEPTDTLDPASILRAEATLLLVRRGEERRLTGLVTEASRKATRRGLAGGAEVRIRFEPKLALLKHRADIRIFREKTAPEIVREVMTGLGVEVQTRLRAKYRRRDYCVQFREPDLDFCHRLLEDEGIYYFIDEMGVVVLGDSPQAYDDVVGLYPFLPGAGLDTQQDSISEIGQVGEMTAGKIYLRDFNHEHPSLDMDVQAPGPQIDGAEWYDYPGEYEEPVEGQAKAKLRADALRCLHHRIAGRSLAAALRPGALFAVAGTPELFADGEHVVTRVEHRWQLDQEGFELAFEALPGDVTYRPALVTHVPVERNPLTGFVTGPAGEDIYTDHWGRVKVHFPWDRLQPKDDTCSHWIPVLQDNTGHSSAMSRTGWEVLCHFLEGDPDRPVVMGRVYNAEDPFYSPLPERKMRIALRSLVSPRSSEGETPANFIQMDDFLGAEAVVIHAQRDQNVVVLNDKREQIDAAESLQVKGNEKIEIGSNHTVQTKSDLKIDVGGNQTRTIGGQHTIGVGSSFAETVEGNHTMAIGAMHKRQFGTSDNVMVSGNMRETIGGVDLEASLKTNSVTAEKTSTLLVGGAVVEISRLNKTDMAGLGKIETIGGVVYKKAGKLMATRTEKLRNTLVGGFFKVDAMKELLLAGVEKLTTKANTVTFDGTSSLTLKVGGTQIDFRDGAISLSTSETISIETSSANNQAAGSSTQS
jgi:type VI secretion system secreted protein VgrG